jgi:hypothetical protein
VLGKEGRSVVIKSEYHKLTEKDTLKEVKPGKISQLIDSIQ